VHAALAELSHGHLLLVDALGQKQFGPSTHAELRAVVRINQPDVYRRILFGGTLAAAEAYLDGQWMSSNLTALLRIMSLNLELLNKLHRKFGFWLSPLRRIQKWVDRNTKSGSKRNIAAHYDLSNDFFEQMLDPTMMYSSGIFKDASASLEEASTEKIDRICRKLDLQPGSHVVEIGTGWGGFAIHAAKHYGCRVTTTTISNQQFEFAKRRFEAEGLQDQITLLQSDYRDLNGQFDHLVSIEMIEAVGVEYLDSYFAKCSDLLKPNGTMALQVITMPDERMDTYRSGVDFIQRYVFPGGFLPSFHLMTGSLYRKTNLRLIHSEDFGLHYARTLQCWRENIEKQMPKIRSLELNNRFLRLWDYYLSYCEAGFLERQIGVSQLVLAKPKFRGQPVLVDG